RIAGHVPEPRLRAALPVLATASVLATLARRTHDQPQALGVKIVSAGREAEFDIVTVADSFTAEVIIGEVKSRQTIDANDIGNLAWAQEHLCDKDIECYILVATLNERFSSEEITALRQYCERGVQLLHPDGSLAPLALPIVLTRQELSVSR